MASPTFEELIQVYLGQGMSRNDAIQLANQQIDSINYHQRVTGEKRHDLGHVVDSTLIASGFKDPPHERVRQTKPAPIDPATLDNITAHPKKKTVQPKKTVTEPKKPFLRQDQGLDFLSTKRVREEDPLESQLPTRRKWVVRPPKQMIEDDQKSFAAQGAEAPARRARPTDLPLGMQYPGAGGRPLKRSEELSPAHRRSNQKVWMDNYGKTHTKSGQPLPHTFDPGSPGVTSGIFKRNGIWVDASGARHQAGIVRPPIDGSDDTRTRDQLPKSERISEYDEILDAQKEFFIKNYTNELGEFDWEKLKKASPKIRAAFAHLQHASRVRARMQEGVRSRELHAEGASEHLYQQAHYKGGVVTPDPDRPGAFIVMDPRTGDKMPYNPAAAKRIKSARQKIANQRRIAENPLWADAASERGAKTRMAIEARRMRGKGRGIEAAMLELNIDDASHPAVLLRAGAFRTPPTFAETRAGRVRKGGGTDWESYTSYAKDYQDRLSKQADMNPGQFATFTMQRGQAGYKSAMADIDKRAAEGTLSRVQAEDERARIERQANAAEAEVRGFNLSPAKPGKLDQKYRRGRDIFAGGSPFGTDIRGHDRWQDWLTFREKMFKDREGNREGRTVVAEDLRQQGRMGGALGHPGAFGRHREDADINRGVMFRHGPQGGRDFIGRDVHKHSITDEQRQAMRDRHLPKDRPVAPGGPGAPAAPVDPDAQAADRFDWHDTTGSSSGHVMPQPPRGIVTSDHLVDTLVKSAGGVSAKPDAKKGYTGNSVNTDEAALWGVAEQIAAHGKPAQAAWLKAMLRKYPQLKNKSGVRRYIYNISESWMPFEDTEGLLVLLGL